MDNQTPISKYLASLERRQALLSPSSPPPDSAAIIRKINFEDDTFLQDQSLLHVSPGPARQGTKRRRVSILGEIMEEEENQNKKLSDLERLLQETQGELIEARALNTKLEHQIIEIKRAQGERILKYESSNNEMRMRTRTANEQADSFKDQLTKISKKEEELREKLHTQTEAHREKMSGIETKLRILETENMELKTKFESGTLKQSDDLRKLSVSLEETEMGAEKWVMETQLLRDQLELKEQQLQKYQKELKEIQINICKYNELKARYDPSSGSDVTTETLQEKIKYFENLYVKQQGENLRLQRQMDKIADDNKMLRTSMNKEMLLEEQICAYEDEVKSLRAALEAKAGVEAEKGNLQSELQTWKSMAFKLDPDCTNPTKLEAYIRKIQNQLLEAMHERSTLKHTILDKDRTISKRQVEAALYCDQIKALQIEKENFTQELKRNSRLLTLVTNDRDGLKALKESYEKEYEGLISMSKPLQERILQLEATVGEYEAMIQEDPSTKKLCSECEKRIALLSEIRAEMERLKQEKAEAETQLTNMSQMSTGDDNTTGIKVVSFGVNPTSLSLEARLKEAIKENEELKQKMKEFQEQTIAEAKGSDEAKQRELEDRNKTLTRKLEILSEAYDFETQQLQLIVNKLCGFHFTLVREPSVQIRLSSIYSQIANDAFIFQESPNGDMLLLESPVLDNFREDIDRFLIREGSIPGFLSSVTITYVQSQSAQNASQLPASQESVQDADEAATATVSVHNPREVQVEVRRQRHPMEGADDEEDEEEPGEEEEYADEEGDHADEEEGEDEENVEEEETYEDEDDDQDDDQDEDEEEDRDSPPNFRGRPQPPPVTGGDDSDDSDIIMID